jgi:hypothetical protein
LLPLLQLDTEALNTPLHIHPDSLEACAKLHAAPEVLTDTES